MSSTFSLGEPISLVSSETVDADAEAEFSEVVNGIKETSLNESEPLSRRPSRPHHSSNQDRDEMTSSTIATTNQPAAQKAAASEVPMNQCMFCNYDSPSFKLNVMHMSKLHGMFIPEQPYLVDPEGLVRYLYGKITQLYECLYCHKLKSSISSIQTHMRDKGHCMIAFDSEEEMIEVGQFYDFSSTYSDDEQASSDDVEMEGANATSDGAQLGSKHSKAIKTVISGSNGDQEMGEGDENAEGWETDSSASSLDSENLTAIPIDHTHAYERLPLHLHHSHTDPRPHHTVDGFHSHAHSHHAVFHSDYELHLPSGRTAGHRALSRYYRQNLHNYPAAAERTQNLMIEGASSTTIPDIEMVTDEESRGRHLTTRASGGIGMLGVTEAKKREVRAVEKREQKREQRNRQQYQWGVNKRGNAQKHFRDPLLQ